MDFETVNGVLVPVRERRPNLLEVATTNDGRDITRGFVDSLPLLPPLDPVLQSRGGDYRVYEELLRDDQVSACFGQLRLAVVGAEWKVDAGGDMRVDKKAAESLEQQLSALDFDRAFDRMLYGVFYGHGVAECIYSKEGSQVLVTDIKPRKVRRFGYSPTGELKLLTMKNPLGEVMPPKKFWTFAYGGDTADEPYGLGLAHALYWPVFFKRNGLKFWLIFLEKFGQPTAVGKYPPNATPEEKKRLLGALGAIHTDGGIIVPEGMLIELLEAARSGTADYSALCDRMDNAIAKVILGQTATTQGTPGKLGNDEAQSNVAEDLIKATSDLLCQSFNRGPVRWLTEWNYPGAVVPKVWRQTEPEEDLNDRAERDGKIFPLGYRPTLASVQETYPGDWEEAPKAPARVPETGPADDAGKKAEFAEGAVAADGLPLKLADRLEIEARAAHQAWIKSLRRMADDAGSLAELRDRLLNAYAELPTEQLAEVMSLAFAVADARGREDVAAEAGQDDVSAG
ncbi:MAG: DUF935 domain-containing protein [Panacagrimonas sp.]